MEISLPVDKYYAAAKAIAGQIARLFTRHSVKCMQVWHLLAHLKEVVVRQILHSLQNGI